MAKQNKVNKPKRMAPKQTAVTPPEIDSAAAAAAAFVAHGGRAAGKTPEPGRRESASFKQLKLGLDQPGSATVSSLLDKSAPPGQQKSHIPLGGPGGNQKGHNQTIGSDASRTGVPRRTGG